MDEGRFYRATITGIDYGGIHIETAWASDITEPELVAIFVAIIDDIECDPMFKRAWEDAKPTRAWMVEEGYEKGALVETPLGEMLKNARKGRHLTQNELAKGVGIATTTLQRYEYGERSPSHDVLMSLLNYMGITYSELIAKYGLPYRR